MKTKKEILLHETYKKFIETSMFDLPLDGIEEFVDPNVMGYGTTLNEKILTISDYRKLIKRQREQGKNIEMKYDSTPVLRKIHVDGSSAVFVDEAVVKILINDESMEMFLRISSVLEYREDKWIVVHFHSSKPEYEEGEKDTWHINEWKQKNAELEQLVKAQTYDLVIKNRELEIETCLERVRTIVLSMKEASDMLEMCRVISEQLDILNVSDVRNVQTAVINETKGTFLNYEYYGSYDKSFITEIDYQTHPTQTAFVTQMLTSSDAFFSKNIKGAELKKWLVHQIETDQFIDPHLEVSNSLNYYFHSIGGVALGLSTYSPLNNEDLIIFKRFRNVFELAYQRFIDIEIAKEQAREAQIEAALERVRSKTMAMHNSDDVGVTVVTLFDEVLNLGLDKSIRCGIGILEGNEGMETWSATSYPDGEVDLKMGMLDMTIHPMLIGLKKAWESGEAGYSYQFTGSDLTKYYNALNNEPEYPFHVELDTLPEKVFHNSFFFSEGILFAFFSNPISEEATKVLNRFASVFGQTYRRYLDLQKAEAQAREAQIEAALERVRARTMAMQNSDELKFTIRVFFEQFSNLGFEMDSCYINILREDTKDINLWLASGEYSYAQCIHVPYIDHPIFNSVIEARRKGLKFLETKLSRNKKNSFMEYAFRESALSEIPSERKKKILDGEGFSRSAVLTKYVDVGIQNYNGQPFTEDENNILKRFAFVFDQTYTRFLDLKHVEEQNIIIQAENERKSQELEEARELQLAMLPKELPDVDNVDIAVYMKTATEVGGDYYDFSTKTDGSINIGLGDATGHGMKAGTLVAMMKSLFAGNSANTELEDFFSTCNNALKNSMLERMMFAFVMINVNGNRVSIVNAGMPPVYIYNGAKKEAEEITVHGMPLGAMSKSTFESSEFTLRTNDVILMITDGMPELQNTNNEMYGYERLKTVFEVNAEKSVKEIINVLKEEGSKWMNDKDPEDDVSFIVIKFK